MILKKKTTKRALKYLLAFSHYVSEGGGPNEKITLYSV